METRMTPSENGEVESGFYKTDEICRLCLSINGDMETLFSDEEREDNYEMLEKIKHCTNIEITPLAGVRSLLCEFCKYKLDLFHNFKVQCEKSEITIRTKYAKEYEFDVKYEPEVLVDVQHDHDSQSIQSFEQDNENNEQTEAAKPSNDYFFNQKRRGRPSQTSLGVKKIFKCEHCEKTFDFRSHLSVHEKIHTGVKPFVCTFCQKSFAQSSNLNSHLKTHMRPFKCQFCERAFSDIQSLEAHLKTHSSEKPFECSYCDRKFTYQSHLEVHVRTHQGDPFPYSCQVCEQKFAARALLNEHLYCHQEMKRFKCDFCDKSFSFRSHLNVHIKIHTGLRPFVCQICGKAFAQVSNLNVHVKKHNQDRIQEQKYYQNVYQEPSRFLEHVMRPNLEVLNCEIKPETILL